MKNYFSERQRFSLRKYSFGLASVLLGTAFFLSGQVASADETPILDRVAVAEASDQQTVASDQQSIPTKKTVDEEAVETTFSEASAGIQESQKTTNNSENSKLNDQISKVDEETTPENKVDVQKTETLDSATSVQNEESKNSYKKSDNSSELKGDYTENKVSDSRLNRSRRAISENGWSSHEIDPKDLSFKAVNIPVISGQYVTRDDINGIKIETDMFDIPWTYNYVIVSKSSNGGEARHRIINIYYKNLGTISFVDSDGNSISGVTTSKVFKNTNNTLTSDDGTPVPDPSDAAITELPKLPAGYRLKTVDGDPTKVEAYIDRQTSDTIYDYSEIHTNEVIDPDSLTPDELDEALKKYPAPKISSETWSLNQKETVTLIRQPDGSYAIDPTIAGNGGNQFAPGTRYRFVIEKDSSQIQQATSQTVTYTGAETNPPQNLQNDFTFTGEENSQTHDKTWKQTSHTYGEVLTPVVTGYYADKTSAGKKTVTPDQPHATDTVTYKKLGKIIQVDEAGNVIPGSVSKTYENNPVDPTQAAETKIPDAPAGYKIKEEQPQAWGYNIVDKTIEPNDESDLDRISRDTPIIYVPIVNDVTKPTKQTVTFEGAGVDTPTPNVQTDFTFTGKQKQADGTIAWDQPSHTYGKVIVPVVEGFYSDKAEAGSKVVTPDQPEVTDKVTYKPLGKIIPVDETNTPIPSAPTPQYNNDPQDPTKGGETPTPVIPGYVTDIPNVTPSNPGADTPVVYRKAEQKAVIKYVDQNTGTTLENDQVSGKSGEAIDYSTAAKIKKYQDRGYVLVNDEFPAGATYDTDASVDQIWTVTLKHGETPVGPNNPHKPTDPIKPNDPKSPKYPAENQWKKGVTSTVHYVVSDRKATAPADNVQNAQWTRTLKLDKVTGEVLSSTPWASNKANYDAVPTPGLTGYYADKGSVASKTVTQENLEETVTYKPLGNLVPKPETPTDPNFPSIPEVKYPNDPTDPTKPGKPIQPGTPVTPDKPGEDTPIIYVPKTTEVTKPTKQTVTFEGAGTATPADKVQDNFTFTGKQKNGTTTWDQPNHTYGKETVPVVEHYYADKKEAGSKTVTPDQPEVTDKVTYKPLGKIIPVDETNTPIPSAPTPQYNNDPQDPTKGGETPTPVIPGYVTDIPNVTPSNPGADTPVVYRKAEQKAVIKYVDQNTGTTLENDQVSGKSGEAIDYSTAAKIKKYQDRGYVLVNDEFPAGATYDTDASVDQIWTVTLKHGETPVGPNDPHNPTDPINPNDPNSPKYPATDQWKKDVTSTVHYVVSDGKTTAPADNVQNAQWTRTLNLDKVTGKVLNPDAPWTANKANYDAVPTPGLTGYYADKGSVASKTVTQENLEETVTYKPLGNLVPKPETPTDPNFPSTPGVKYPNDPTDPTKPGKPVVPDVPGYEPHLPDPNDPTKPGKPIQPGTPVTPDKPGEDTPIIYVPIANDVTKPTKQTVTFEGAGEDTPTTNVQDSFTFTGKHNPTTNTTTWNESSHTYGKLIVPVVDGYYSDKIEAGSKTVTPDQPEVTDHVVYKPLGSLVPKSDDPNFPSTPDVKYPNDPTDPTKPGQPVVPDVPGYKPYLPDPKDPSKPGQPVEPGKPITPENPGDDTPIIYVPIVNDVKKPTKQTVKFEGAGDKTPGDNVQDDFTFTGKENKASGTTTWIEKSHTYGKVSVPVIPGYYADKTEAGGKTVTPENPEATDTVTYKPLGSLVPKSDDPKFPSTPDVKYPNDPTDPTKPSKPVVPNVPGYKPYLPDPKDPSKPGKPVEPGKELPNLPTNPGDDTPIIYVPIVPVTPEKPVAPEKPTSAKENTPQLPNTGTEDHTSLSALGLLGVMSGFGLVVRKKKED